MNHEFLKIELNSHCDLDKTSGRIRHLFYENNDIFKEHELELWGIVNMVSGLEYHFKNFVEIENNCREIESLILKEGRLYDIPGENAIHEVVAYLNVLGRIYAVFKSELFLKHMILLNELCPAINAIIQLRNKFAAHRSVDCPRDETEAQKANHAGLPLGLMWTGSLNECKKCSKKVKVPGTPVSICFKHTYLTYSIRVQKNKRYKHDPVEEIEFFSEKEVFVYFIPSKHHEKICKEIESILNHFFSTVKRNPKR